MKNDIILKRIRQLMDQNAMNQSEFSKKIGIRQQNLSAILKGKRPCGNAIINKIILAFNLRTDFFVGTDEAKEFVNQQSECGDINVNRVSGDLLFQDKSIADLIKIIKEKDIIIKEKDDLIKELIMDKIRK